MSTDKVRSEFESRFPVPLGIAWNDGAYHLFNQRTCTKLSHRFYLGCWESWQASREALVIELPPLSGMNSSFVADGIQKTREHNRYNAAVKDCRKAIESAGLKVKP